MTPPEFLLWLRGYTGAIDKRPTSIQWNVLRGELDKVDAGSVAVAGSPVAALQPAFLSPAPPPSLAPANPQPSERTEAAWRGLIKSQLIANGCDDDMATQMSREEPLNINADPIMIANSLFSVD